MRHNPKRIADLLGSRLCHDLISPIGAVCNGVELLAMGPLGNMPELALISDSIEAANFRVQFYRVAYGLASDDQALSEGEARRILAGVYKGARLRVDWAVKAPMPRPEVKLAFLLIQCLEDALPYGGNVRITHNGMFWRIEGDGRIKMKDQALWDGICSGAEPEELAPNSVHYALIPYAVEDAGRRIICNCSEDHIELNF